MKLKIWFYILFFFCLSTVLGQIQPIAFPIPADEFVIYKEHRDSVRQLSFQIGCYEPKDTLSLRKLHNKANDARTKILQKEQHIYYVHAPIYLKIHRQDSETYYFLDDYYDPDMYGFQDSVSDNLLLITARYHLYLFDYKNKTLSNKLNPGLDQYEGEDAISGLYSALTVFNNSKFLLGNGQAFGIFCFDISDPAQPVELKQYQIPSEEHTAFYAFLYPKGNQQYDVLMVRVDSKSVSSRITRFYRKLEIIRYAARNICIANNAEGLPDVTTVGDYLIIQSDGGIHKVNLATGIVKDKIGNYMP